MTLDELVEAIRVEAAKPDTVWCGWLGCLQEATYTVRSKRMPKRPYCVEHSHGVAAARQSQGHEEVRRVPIKEG
jgi:hypothetical protein